VKNNVNYASKFRTYGQNRNYADVT